MLSVANKNDTFVGIIAMHGCFNNWLRSLVMFTLILTITRKLLLESSKQIGIDSSKAIEFVNFNDGAEFEKKKEKAFRAFKHSSGKTF